MLPQTLFPVVVVFLQLLVYNLFIMQDFSIHYQLKKNEVSHNQSRIIIFFKINRQLVSCVNDGYRFPLQPLKAPDQRK